ncbi:MAG: bifunctional 4-hydroxy-2-oxoglutarate aldolase/2-dehydro-3-deoxy-phosphogluconate aldolase [Sphingobacteriales bacterium]|nr:bifunctional 4-hydroxy-2-oxoglutarate aldolase/2-dehydro-3-deoxy-phosphogluconate aldolase [Sphingobacteriales bacterium]OJW32928.1 MAG: bifunctional 4-hydroxy-2-oxoglutarate aldolase/2-dehydro-3-deoxy-phosphogluconate aldolase [Sphingobacteriales bacterium 46-32]
MESNQQLIRQISEQGLLPLFYHADSAVCTDVVRALYGAGIRVVEFTNRGAQALENLKQLHQLRLQELPDLIIGAGTITTADQANRFLDAGADFLVSPVFDNDVCDVAYLRKVLWIPGCMTPTEIHVAESAGCRFVKLFPGNVLGFGFVSAIKELFPGMSFMPTGGVEVSRDNLKSWFDAGVCAVGLGSKLISKQLLDDKGFDTIERKTKEALEILRSLHK